MARIPSQCRFRLRRRSPSVIALSATLQLSSDTDFVTTSLGMVQDAFTLLRRSNGRSNTQFIIEVLKHGLGENDFSCLLCHQWSQSYYSLPNN